MDFSGCANDDSIGPAVQGCRDDFDFTIRFERIFLSLIPTAVFIALSLPRAVHLVQRPAIVGGTVFQAVKAAAVAVFVALQLALLVLSCTTAHKFEALLFSSAALGLVSALCTTGLSTLEHWVQAVHAGTTPTTAVLTGARPR